MTGIPYLVQPAPVQLHPPPVQFMIEHCAAWAQSVTQLPPVQSAITQLDCGPQPM